MPTVILSERTNRHLARFTDGPMTARAKQLHSVIWAFQVDGTVLQAIQDQRLPGESDDAVIWRLMTATFPLRLLLEPSP
jgi:hypothetical protein